MTCPICDRVMCDHSPAERGQTSGEMMQDYYRDARTSSISAQDALEARFGYINIKIIKKSKNVRVSTRSTDNRQVLAYNIVDFLEARKLYPKIHQQVLSGRAIAKTFQSRGYELLRLERCSFSYDLPKSLRSLFRTKEGKGCVKSISLYIDKREEERRYADIIEVYSPIVGLDKRAFEIERGLINRTKERLESMLRG